MWKLGHNKIMINLLNRSQTKIENLIYTIREKENDLWNEYMEIVNTYGAESTFAAEMDING